MPDQARTPRPNQVDMTVKVLLSVLTLAVAASSYFTYQAFGQVERVRDSVASIADTVIDVDKRVVAIEANRFTSGDALEMSQRMHDLEVRFGQRLTSLENKVDFIVATVSELKERQ